MSPSRYRLAVTVMMSNMTCELGLCTFIENSDQPCNFVTCQTNYEESIFASPSGQLREFSILVRAKSKMICSFDAKIKKPLFISSLLVKTPLFSKSPSQDTFIFKSQSRNLYLFKSKKKFSDLETWKGTRTSRRYWDTHLTQILIKIVTRNL